MGGVLGGVIGLLLIAALVCVMLYSRFTYHARAQKRLIQDQVYNLVMGVPHSDFFSDAYDIMKTNEEPQVQPHPSGQAGSLTCMLLVSCKCHSGQQAQLLALSASTGSHSLGSLARLISYCYWRDWHRSDHYLRLAVQTPGMPSSCDLPVIQLEPAQCFGRSESHLAVPAAIDV